MTSEFLVFRAFYTEEEAISLMEFLKGKGIDCSITKYSPIMDRVYVGVNYYREFHVMIRGFEFDKANEILDRHIDQNISEIGEDYYLYSFTDKELLEIIEKPDEWSNQDIVISKKMLQDRGVTISDADVKQKKLSRLEKLEKHEREDGIFIILGYFFSLFFGFFGIAFGLVMMSARKTLPDGRWVFLYDNKTRSHGKNILIIGLIITALVLFRILSNLL